MKLLLALILSVVGIANVASAVPVSDADKLLNLRTAVEQRAELFPGQASSSVAHARDTEGGSLALRMFQGLAICLIALSVGVWLYKKTAGKNAPTRSGRIQLIDRIAISPRSALVLARVDGKEVFLSVGFERVSFGYPQVGTDFGEEQI